MRLPPFRISTAAASAAFATLLALGSPAAAAGIELEDDIGRKLALAPHRRSASSASPRTSPRCSSPPARASAWWAQWITATTPRRRGGSRVGGYTRIDLEAVAALARTW